VKLRELLQRLHEATAGDWATRAAVQRLVAWAVIYLAGDAPENASRMLAAVKGEGGRVR
jgi:hypothetical protein